MFLSVSKKNNKYKQNVFFDKYVWIKKIQCLPYFDRFTDVIINVEAKLPKYLLRLTVHAYTIESIEIPSTVTHLTFGYGCNENLFNYIPNTITNLVIDKKIIKSIKGCIPESVTYLNIDCPDYISDLSGWIPKNVSEFILGEGYKGSLENCIPKSVKYLEIKDGLQQNIELHHGITHLICRRGIHENITIPSTMTHLDINNYESVRIPNGVKYLETGDINGQLPNSITHIVYYETDLQKIKNLIPSSVTHFEIKSNYYKYDSDDIPASITHLVLPKCTENCIRNIPTHVEHVTYKKWEEIGELVGWDCVPSHVKSVTLGNFCMNRPFNN
jgi:hypothetical protein